MKQRKMSMKDNSWDVEKMLNAFQLGFFRYALKPQERFLDVNDAFVNTLGCQTRGQILNKKLSVFFCQKGAYQAFFHLLEQEKTTHYFKALVQGNPKKAPVTVLISARLLRQQKVLCIEGCVQNVTDTWQDQQKFLDEAHLMESFLDQMPDAIYFKDIQCRITKVNRFYAKGFKMKPEEIIGKTDYDFFPKDQASKMINDDQQVMRTGVPIVGKIERTLLPNKTWNQVITTKVPIYDRKGKVIGLMGITRDMTAHANLERERFNMLVNALTVLNRALGIRDPYTFSHAQNVARIAEIIGQELKFEENQLVGLKLAADLHDLGKISVPLDILTKPGSLTTLEYNLIKEHVQRCHDLIKEIPFPFALSEMIYQHHERLDGTGYPNRLKGDKIMLEAKILAVSDVLESMTSHRPYRPALGIKKALKELRDGAGRKYDIKLVKLIEDLVRKNKGKPFWPVEK